MLKIFVVAAALALAGCANVQLLPFDYFEQQARDAGGGEGDGE